MVLQSGHADDYAGRRFFVPGTPVGWSADGLLTQRGWDSMLTLAYGWMMGASGYSCGGEIQLLHAYPWILTPEAGNLGGVAFRLIHYLRVCQYVDKAPEESRQLWP